LWVPSTRNIKPQSSSQYVLGWGLRTKNQFWINVEAYYKRLNDIIDFAANSSLSQINSYNWENKIVVGQGTAYGLELMLEKKIGRTRGLFSYTLAKSERQFDELNNGNPFPFRFDRRHNFKTYLIHELGKRWTFSMGFTYGTGLAVSLPTREFVYYLPSEHLVSPIFTDIFTEKNNVRLSPNHRLDLQFSYHLKQKKLEQELSIGVYNLYNRKNALYYRPGQNPDEPSEETYLKASLIPILPYINYTIKF
jgi:Outer membrane receptor proteins, mostly Fe transport